MFRWSTSAIGHSAAAVLLTLHALGAPVSAADDAAAKEAIAKLLEVGWSTAIPARAAADKQFLEVTAVAGADGRGEYALVLVLLQQRRYEDAGKQIDAMIDRDPTDVYAWRARVWLSALTKNYPAAMTAAQKMAPQLAASNTALEDDSVRRDMATFLGRIYGFLGGPAAEKVKLDERKRSEKHLESVLSEELRAAFEEGRNSVIDQYTQLADLKQDTREKAKADAEEDQKKTLEDVEQHRKRVDERKEMLKDGVDRASAELRAETDELMKLDRPLAAEASRVQLLGSRVESDLVNLLNQIAVLQAELRREMDPTRRDFIRQQIISVEFTAGRVRGDLRSLEQQAASIQAQRNQLAARLQAAQQRYGGEINKANRESNQLDGQLKKADAVERLAGKPVSGTTAKVTALGAQAAALTTYEPFPLEQEKRRLLDLLK